MSFWRLLAIARSTLIFFPCFSKEKQGKLHKKKQRFFSLLKPYSYFLFPEVIFKTPPKILCKIGSKWQFLRLFLILEVILTFKVICLKNNLKKKILRAKSLGNTGKHSGKFLATNKKKEIPQNMQGKEDQRWNSQPTQKGPNQKHCG